ncbi:MAG: thiol reductant ABC exporter subunit CydD, partial [Micromonosporaceae bacterium]|nr:thiol reductant ABC exporter subunit CydD [Micromonosporaceae bacterium]
VLAAVVPVIVLAKIMPADQIAGWTIIVTLPLIPLFMVLIGLHSQRASSRRFAMLSRLSHHFLDVVSGLPTLKAYRRTAAQETTIRTVTNAYRSMTMRTLRIAFLSSFTLELVATLSVALVAVGIGLRLVSGTLDYPTALLVLILAPEAYAPIRQVSTNFHAATEGLAAASDVFVVLETPVPAQRGGTALPDLARAPISLVDLTVRYPERSSPVFSNLNLSVAPGEIVALTGRSGCGKSTILAALMGFIEPERGRVMIGSTPLADLDLVALRRSIAWVPQRPWLFSGTIMDNIRLGQPEACPEAVRLAARAAGAERFIDELPDGFATVLAEGGGGLSAGQRQRLALARAFLRDAPLVLLDEPTANLDGETEAGILRAVRSLTRGRTVILAAHRAALTGLADREVPL